MKIIYVARHDQQLSNDDEGAITHAFNVLGHDVQRVREQVGSKAARLKGDLLLFHKWEDVEALKQCARFLPCVCWYFDLVDYPDPSLKSRCEARQHWLRSIMPHARLIFMTDGDWVHKVNGSSETPLEDFGKLVWLPQGADERVAKLYEPDPKESPIDILFTGIRAGGKQRATFVAELEDVYHSKFHHIQRGVYGANLGRLIARSKIVVAPDGPVKDYYWSNRVYLTLGYGGFLLHPYCEGLAKTYDDGKDLYYYRSREELHQLIRYYLPAPQERAAIAEVGYRRTLREHLYRHRVRQLLDVVRRRLGIGSVGPEEYRKSAEAK